MRIRGVSLLASICLLTTGLSAQESPGKAEPAAGAWRVTGVLLIDQPPKGLAFGLQGESEAKPATALKPSHVFTGHGVRREGTAWLEDLLKRTEEALAKPD